MSTIYNKASSPFFDKIAVFTAASLPILILMSRTLADLSVIMIGSLFIIKSFCTQQWQWLRRPWLAWFSVFIIYLLLINTPLSLQPVESFAYTLFFIRWPLFALALAYWVWQTPRAPRLFFMSLVCCIIFLVFDSWLQYLSGQDLLGHPLNPIDPSIPPNRLTGPFTRPLIGIMLVRLLFITLIATCYFKAFQSLKSRYLFTLGTLLIGIVTIFITGERMAFLLAIFGFLTVLAGYWLNYPTIRKKVAFGMLLILVCLSIAVIVMPDITDRVFIDGLAKLNHFAASDYGTVFGAAWQAWQTNWWIGSGLHTYQTYCTQLGLLNGTIFECSHAHNLYLQLGAETGLIGLCLFCISILSLYWSTLTPLLNQKLWWLASLAFTLLNMGFWPLIGGISVLNNWVAAFVWLGVSWAIALSLFSHIKNDLTRA